MSLAAKYSLFRQDKSNDWDFSYNGVMAARRKFARKAVPNYSPAITIYAINDMSGARPYYDAGGGWICWGVCSLTDFPGCVGIFCRVEGRPLDRKYYCILDTETDVLTPTETYLSYVGGDVPITVGPDGKLYCIQHDAEYLFRMNQDGSDFELMPDISLAHFCRSAHENEILARTGKDHPSVYSVSYSDFTPRLARTLGFNSIDSIQKFPFGWILSDYWGKVWQYDNDFHLVRSVSMGSFHCANSFVPDMNDDMQLWTLSPRNGYTGYNASTGAVRQTSFWPTDGAAGGWCCLPWGALIGEIGAGSRVICYDPVSDSLPLDMKFSTATSYSHQTSARVTMLSNGKILITPVQPKTPGLAYEVWDFGIGDVPANLLHSEYAFASHIR